MGSGIAGADQTIQARDDQPLQSSSHLTDGLANRPVPEIYLATGASHVDHPAAQFQSSLRQGRLSSRGAWNAKLSARNWWYKAAQGAKFFFAGLSFALPLFLKADATKMPEALRLIVGDQILWIQTWAWVLIPFAVILAALCKAAASRIGDPTFRDVLHSMLDAIRKQAFNGAASAASPYQHHHRVTLFRYKQWKFAFRRWPWSGWLVPVMRSGHTTQRCTSYFRAPDNPEKAEGIAGAAWNMEKGCKVSGLPDISGSASNLDISNYASLTKMGVRWTKGHRPQACSFYALKVLDKGKPWGVLVVDSKAQEIDERKVTKAFQTEGQYLTFFGKRLAP